MGVGILWKLSCHKYWKIKDSRIDFLSYLEESFLKVKIMEVKREENGKRRYG